MSSRPFCAEVSARAEEPLAATASFLQHWILVEYRGLWDRRPLQGSLLSELVKLHLEAQLAALPRSRLLFIRRPERRRHPTLACFYGVSSEREPRFFELELETYDDLPGFDLAAALQGGRQVGRMLDEPIFLVCTHGKRDRCCARYGRPLYDELRGRCGDLVWQSTHVGGDRFAGNLVVFPEGLYFGRVGRADVEPIVGDYRGGRVFLDRFRGRSSYPFPVQAAERVVRLETGLLGLDDLRLVSRERDGDRWRVRFSAGGGAELHEVDVVAEHGSPAHLTCDAVSPELPRRFRAAGHRIVPR